MAYTISDLDMKLKDTGKSEYAAFEKLVAELNAALTDIDNRLIELENKVGIS